MYNLEETDLPCRLKFIHDSSQVAVRFHLILMYHNKYVILNYCLSLFHLQHAQNGEITCLLQWSSPQYVIYEVPFIIYWRNSHKICIGIVNEPLSNRGLFIVFRAGLRSGGGNTGNGSPNILQMWASPFLFYFYCGEVGGHVPFIQHKSSQSAFLQTLCANIFHHFTT